MDAGVELESLRSVKNLEELHLTLVPKIERFKIPLTCYRRPENGEERPKNGFSPHRGTGGKMAEKWEKSPETG